MQDQVEVAHNENLEDSTHHAQSLGYLGEDCDSSHNMRYVCKPSLRVHSNPVVCGFAPSLQLHPKAYRSVAEYHQHCR